MKVLIINTVNFLINGISNVIMENYRQLRSSDITFDFVINKVIDSKYEKEILSINESKVFILPSRTKNIFQYRKELSKILKVGKYDIVHIHGNSSTMIIETSLRAIRKSKVIVHGHNIDCTHPLIHNLLYPLFKNTYDLAIGCSDEAGKFAFKNDYIVVKNTINTAKYDFSMDKRNLLRNEYGFMDKKVFLHVGLFNEQKNQSFLIDVINDIKDKNDKVFVFIGVGPKMDDIIKKVHDLNLDEYVLFLGEKDNVEDYYSMADFFLLPSLYESFGLVLLEAQISGLKCISANRVPHSINFTSNITFIDLDKKLWVEEINNCMINDSRHGYVKEAIEAGYDSTSISEVYENIYEDLIID